MVRQVLGLTCRKLQQELKPILDADVERIIPCHGDVIETGGKSILQQCFGKFLDP